MQEQTFKHAKQRVNSGCKSFSRGRGGRKGINSGSTVFLFQGVLKGSDTERHHKELTLELILEEAGVTKRFNLGVNSAEAHADLHAGTKN